MFAYDRFVPLSAGRLGTVRSGSKDKTGAEEEVEHDDDSNTSK